MKTEKMIGNKAGKKATEGLACMDHDLNRQMIKVLHMKPAIPEPEYILSSDELVMATPMQQDIVYINKLSIGYDRFSVSNSKGRGDVQ